MPVQLLIRDGSPAWYLSPDITVVPGDDPAGPGGSPIAGLPAYLWARVQNTGDVDASNVRVDFYWANPALQVTRSNATLVGSAFATVPAGAVQEALCLVPWIPTIVNDGHECLLAVANHPGDPLPNPLPDAFDPPTYRQVAQKNLTVLVASLHATMLTLTVGGLQRVDKVVTVTAQVGGELDEETLEGLGLHEARPARGQVVEVGLHRERRCVGDDEPIGEEKLDVRAPRGTSAAVFAAVRARELSPGEYQLVRFEERSEHELLGGSGYIVVSERGEEPRS